MRPDELKVCVPVAFIKNVHTYLKHFLPHFPGI